MVEALRANPTTFDSVWAALKEVAENQKETDRQMKEFRREWEKLREESRREWNESWRKSNQEWDNRFGEISEYLVAPKLLDKFYELGFNFLEVSSNSSVTDKENNIIFGIDILLRNYGKAMLVEVRIEPTIEDVQEHIKRLEKMRRYADLHGERRTFLGGVAGVVMTDNVRDYVLKQGLFAIEPSGETFNITQPDNKPKEW